jgi:cell fate regulator YaaT (PSP1 superfamily)
MGSSGYLSRGCGCYPKPTHKNETVFKHSCNKLDVYDWLNDIPLPEGGKPFDCVEVRFKNSRKDFFRDISDLGLKTGDIVAVESNPGHDIGVVTLSGELVRHQMNSKKFNPEKAEIKKVYRKAKPSDIEKWVSAIEQERLTMFKARKKASELGLAMKISDVEYQGDKTKAIFYYTADERVDFRELIKILAEEFMIRIEMRQIGVRQESSRLGGIGSCGRELCCATWLTQFSSVSTSSARVQQLSLNPQKLAGQCSKLKCCLNYEFDVYQDALKDFPDTDVIIKTKAGDAYPQKSDIFRGIIWYAYTNALNNFIPVPIEKAKIIQEMNKKGLKPPNIEDYAEVTKEKSTDFENVVGQDDITRFDDNKTK